MFIPGQIPGILEETFTWWMKNFPRVMLLLQGALIIPKSQINGITKAGEGPKTELKEFLRYFMGF